MVASRGMNLARSMLASVVDVEFTTIGTCELNICHPAPQVHGITDPALTMNHAGIPYVIKRGDDFLANAFTCNTCPSTGTVLTCASNIFVASEHSSARVMSAFSK